MKYSSRFFLYAPLGLFLAIALGVGIQWWLVASALSARLQAMNGHEIAPGITLHFASRTISGFPFNLDTVFRDLSLRIDTPHGPTEWRSEEFAMHALTYGRDETIFEAAGKQELRWTKDDGSKRALVFAVGSLHASAIGDRAGLTRFDLDIVGFGSKAMTARRLQFHIRHDKDNTLDLAVMADGTTIAPGTCPNLGDGVDRVTVGSTITRADSFSALRLGTQRWEAAVKQWRTVGGKVSSGGLWLAPNGSPQTNQTIASLRFRSALLQIPADRVFIVSDLLNGVCGETRH